MTLTRDEQCLLWAAGGFLSIIAHQGLPEAAPQGGGGPHSLLGHEGVWIEYAARGVWCHYWTESDPRQLLLHVTWSKVRKHAESLPDDLLRRLRDHLRRRREHQVSPPGYPGRWRGVPFVVPRNGKGQTWEEVDQWWHDVHMPGFRRLNAEGAALLDEVYPLPSALPELTFF